MSFVSTAASVMGSRVFGTSIGLGYALGFLGVKYGNKLVKKADQFDHPQKKLAAKIAGISLMTLGGLVAGASCVLIGATIASIGAMIGGPPGLGIGLGIGSLMAAGLIYLVIRQAL